MATPTTSNVGGLTRFFKWLGTDTRVYYAFLLFVLSGTIVLMAGEL